MLRCCPRHATHHCGLGPIPALLLCLKAREHSDPQLKKTERKCSFYIMIFCLIFFRLVLERHHHNSMAVRHIAIETWLTNLDLKEYQEVFQKYNGVEVGCLNFVSLIGRVRSNQSIKGDYRKALSSAQSVSCSVEEVLP